MAETNTKKVGIFRRIGRSFKNTKAEFKKVVWPTKKQLFNNTFDAHNHNCNSGFLYKRLLL